MATLTSRELAVRERIESLIRVLAPGLDLLLAVGDRVSRLVDRDDDWEPPRALGPRPEPGDAETVSRRDPLEAGSRPHG